MELNTIATAVTDLMSTFETQPISEQIEVLVQQIGMKTETFDIMSLPLRARPAFIRLILLLVESAPDDVLTTVCATAYISAVAISRAYDDPAWREKLE